MPIEVVDSDGTVIEFPDGTPQRDIVGVMRRRDQERDARTRSGDPRVPGSVAGATVGRAPRTPRTPYERAYAREQRVNNPRQSAFSRNTNFAQYWPDAVGFGDELAGGAAFVGQGAENLIRRATGREIDIPAGVAGQAAMDQRRDQYARFRREQPGQNVGANVMGGLALLGTPARGAVAPMSALEAGATAAAVNAPFAVARQEGALQERLPGALQETAAVGAFGAGLQGVANRLMPRNATRPVTRAAERAADFEAAGVRPTLAAVNQGTTAGATRMISENFIAGAPARARMQASLDDTADAARRLSQQYGQHGPAEQVGERVQAGIERFTRDADAPRPQGRPEAIPTRDWSFRAKANALYDTVFDAIRRDETGHLTGRTGIRATADATRRTLQQIQSRVRSPNVAEIVNDPLIGRIAGALHQDADRLRFGDLRALRTWVREARTRPQLSQTISEADLARLEGALTEDIYTSAHLIGGEYAAAQLRRVDRFYRAGQARIQNALQPFADRTGRGAYERIRQLASRGPTQNTRALQSLRRSLKPDEWREVAATLIDDMGRPTSGNPNVLEPDAFSVNTFVTNYDRLSPEGRAVLFGGAGQESLERALDTLARVAGYQKGVEAMANRSRSGVNVQNVGTAAGVLNPSTVAPTLALLAGATITGEMMTNPAFVRWLASAPKAGASAGGMRQQLAALARLAARDPALAPLYAELSRGATDQFRAQPAQQPLRTEGSQLPRSTTSSQTETLGNYQ